MRSGAVVLFLVLLAWGIPCVGEDISSQLRNQYQGKILLLRHPIQNDFLKYNANGEPLKRAPEGPWTVYGAIKVEKVELQSAKLRVEGSRMFLQYDPADQRLVPFQFKRLNRPMQLPIKESAKVEIRLDQPVNSAAEANAILARVFASNKADFVDAGSELWRSYLDQHMTFTTQSMEFGLTSSGGQNSSSEANRGSPADEPIYKLGKGIEAPKPKSMLDPDYTDVARYERFTGTLILSIVLDKTGKVIRVAVVRPLGLGLDESAAKTVKEWIFNPATRNGEAVAVQMNVEVSFNLY